MSLPSDQSFAVDAAAWQAAFLYFAIGIAGQAFVAEAPLSYLRRFGMLKEPFPARWNWEPELVAHLQERVEGFRLPSEVVTEYADWLMGGGVLRRAGRGWQVNPTLGRRARGRIEEARAAKAAREREDQLRKVLRAVLAALPGTVSVTVTAWMESPLPELGASPREIVRAGGSKFFDLTMRLAALVGLGRPGSDPFKGGLLGLPLEGLRQARREQMQVHIEEMHASKEAYRREAEEYMRREAERRRKALSDFLETLMVQATGLLGEEAGRVWVEDAVRTATGAPFEEGRFALD